MTAHNPWLEHVAKVKKKNMNLAYKEVLKLAKISYKGGSSTTSKQNGGSINKKIIKGGKNDIAKKQNGGTIKKKIIKGGKNDISKKQNGGTIKKNSWLLHVANIKKKNKNLAYKDVLILAKKSYKGGSVKKNKKGGGPSVSITFQYPDWNNPKLGPVSKLLQDAMIEIKNNKLYNLFFDNILTTTMGANSLNNRGDKDFGGDWKGLINGAYNNYLKLCCKDNQPIISDVWKDKNFKIAHGAIIPILTNNNLEEMNTGLYGAVGHAPIGALPYMVRGILNCDTTYSGTVNTGEAEPLLRLPLIVKVSFTDNNNWCIKVKTKLKNENDEIINQKLYDIFKNNLVDDNTYLEYYISSKFLEGIKTVELQMIKGQFIIGFMENKIILGKRPNNYNVDYEIKEHQFTNSNKFVMSDIQFEHKCYLFADIEGNLNWLKNSIKLIPEGEENTLHCFLGDTWDRGSIDEENEIYKIIEFKQAKVVLGNRDVNKTRIIESYCDEISMLQDYVNGSTEYKMKNYFEKNTIDYLKFLGSSNLNKSNLQLKNGRIIACLGTDEAHELLKDYLFKEETTKKILNYSEQGPLQSRTVFEDLKTLGTNSNLCNCLKRTCNKCSRNIHAIGKDNIKKFYNKLNEEVSNIINNNSTPNSGVNTSSITRNSAIKALGLNK